MQKWIARLKSDEMKLARKIIYISFVAAAFLFDLILFFIPFLSFSIYNKAGRPLSYQVVPFQFLNHLQDPLLIESDTSFFSAAILVFWLLSLAVMSAFVIQCIIGLIKSEKHLKRGAMGVVITSLASTGLYFWGAILFNLINNAVGGKTSVVFGNIVPFIFMLLVGTAFFVFVGMMRNSYHERLEPKQRKTARASRIELFVYATVVFVLLLGACLSTILKVVTDGNEIYRIQGIDFMKNANLLTGGEQTISFLIFFVITIASVLFILSLFAMFSSSKFYFRTTIIAVFFGVIGCFALGMFGKYYEIVQKLNIATLGNLIEEQYGVTLNLASVSYKVSSGSFWFFVLALGVVIVLMFRKPYSKGIAIEHALFVQQDAEIAAKALKDAGPAETEVVITKMPEQDIPSGTAVGGFGSEDPSKVRFADPCPAFTELDGKVEGFQADLAEKQQNLFENPTLPKLVQFIVDYARNSRLHLSYTLEDIATFVAGLGTTKLSILQGMSGTGKTSLPKIFSEALYSRCDIVEVESSWRDKNELLGYYNEFSKTYTPKKFTQALYRAKLNPDVLTFIVLDEMNLSRIEYYFSDFLSLMENEEDKRELKLLNVSVFRKSHGKTIPYLGLTDGHTLKIPSNVWFIGTANRDESTFEISDKVYDRAHTMNFNKRAQKVRSYSDPLAQQFLTAQSLQKLFDEAKRNFVFNIDDYPVIAEVEKLLSPYNISFGNRIAMQIESFVSIYCSCFTITEDVIHDAVEKILLSKVVSKLELKSVPDKEELADKFDRLKLYSCRDFILKLNED